jgi:Bacterial PH domain
MAANQSPQTAATPSGVPGGKPLTFRSATAVIVWVLWLLFAAANWIDLAVQGRDRGALIAAAVLLLATGIGYVTAQRPRVIADDAGMTISNPLRDHRVGWPAVAKIDLADLLRVHCAWGPGADGKEHHKTISAWAVHFSRRRQLAADVRARRRAGRGNGSGYVPFGRAWPYASTPSADGSAEEADALRTARLLSELAEREHPGRAEPPGSTWSWRAIAALIVPALILLAASLA